MRERATGPLGPTSFSLTSSDAEDTDTDSGSPGPTVPTAATAHFVDGSVKRKDTSDNAGGSRGSVQRRRSPNACEKIRIIIIGNISITNSKYINIFASYVAFVLTSCVQLIK